ncbi:MAG: thioredoxin [Candidatus Nanohaloarchaea archaeon]
MVEELDSEGLEQAMESGETWIIDFWAEWCGPCKKMKPEFEQASKEVEDVKFGKVDMEEYQQLGTKMGVRALPTVILVRDGEEVGRKSGYMSKKDLKQWIESA